MTLRVTDLATLAGAPTAACSVVVLMCSHNRRDTTLRAMRSLEHQIVQADVRAAVVLLDDGSTDGTAAAVSEVFPVVSVIRGDGSAFWARGMEIAQRHALAVVQPDFLFWLNDDVLLEPDALKTMLETARSLGDEAVVVGAVTDAHSGDLTYSGYLRVGRRPTQLQHVPPAGNPVRLDTFNGNVVLVPRRVYDDVGSIDGAYAHAYGDTDYGYRVGYADRLAVLAPRRVGSCTRNDIRGTWVDRQLTLRQRFAHLISSKGIPPRSYIRFQRRHGGQMWLLNVVGRYASAVYEIAVETRLSRSHRHVVSTVERVASRRETL
jgi:glycosyltransferase involved in cell wall biosynthesis